MKKYLFCTLSLLVIVFFTSCKKDAGNSNTAPANNPPSAVTTGTWTVSSFTQRTEDKTSTFAGMSFVFASDGHLVVSGTNTANGTWIFTGASNGYYGSTNATFSINVGSSAPFNHLSKTWNIAEQTSTILKLDNPETLENEHVSFSKQ